MLIKPKSIIEKIDPLDIGDYALKYYQSSRTQIDREWTNKKNTNYNKHFDSYNCTRNTLWYI